MTRTDWRDQIHPYAWWAWGAAIAVVGSRSPSWLALLVAAVTCGFVWLVARDQNARRTFNWALGFAAALVAVRVLLQLLLGADSFAEPWFSLPRLELPLGLHIGGAISRGAIEFATTAGLQLAVIVIGIAAAGALCPPQRLLACMPPALQELGMLLTISITMLPHLARDARRLRDAGRWRGEHRQRLGWMTTQVVPLFESAIERSIALGAAIYLRRPPQPVAMRTRAVDALAALLVTVATAAWLFADWRWALAGYAIGLGLLLSPSERARTRPLTRLNRASVAVLLAVLLLGLACSQFSNQAAWLATASVLLVLSPLPQAAQ